MPPLPALSGAPGLSPDLQSDLSKWVLEVEKSWSYVMLLCILVLFVVVLYLCMRKREGFALQDLSLQVGSPYHNLAQVCPQVAEVQNALTGLNISSCLNGCENTGPCKQFCKVACQKKFPADAACTLGVLMIADEFTCCRACSACPNSDGCQDQCQAVYGSVCNKGSIL